MKKIIISFFLLLLFLFPASFNLVESGVIASNNIALADSATFTNPMPGVNTANDLIGNVINAVMGFVGSLALLMFVFGGLTWMTSAGSQEKVKKGKDIVIWSAIGLILIFSAYALTNLIINYAVN